MNNHSPIDDIVCTPLLSGVPVLKWLPRVYRSILTVTRRHGLHTLARIHSAIFRRGHIIAMPLGGRLYAPQDPHYFGYTSLMHERHIEDVIVSVAKPGDVCIDIGANIGYFSVRMAAQVKSGGTVYAFEPVPETFAVLQANAQLAAADSLRILPFCQAVSADDGHLFFTRMQDSTLNQMVKVDDKDIRDSAEKVTAVTLTSALTTLGYSGNVALIKIDVEGHELDVIEGARSLLDQGRIGHMIIEVFPGVSAQKIEEVLENYPCSIRVWRDHEWREIRLGNLDHATDVLVEFHSRKSTAFH